MDPLVALAPAAPAALTVVVVLYKRLAAKSEAVVSLMDGLGGDPALAQRFSLLVYDNSPERQAGLPPAIPAAYHHDPANGGLAAAYSYALAHAEAARTPWLLLLDQDTHLTREYLLELAALTEELLPAAEIGAIVPKLRLKGTLYSPEAHFFEQLRRIYPHRSHALPPTAHGPQLQRISAYNSGAALRVRSLRAIGGFPPDFWLDYLDHAVFHALQAQGSRVYVMRAGLEQQLSHYDLDSVPIWRHRNVLAAQTRFVKRFGGLRERLLYRAYLLNMARLSFRQCRDRRVWLEKLLHALLLPNQPFGHRARRAPSLARPAPPAGSPRP